MGEKPISKGSALFVEIFCLGDEVQFRNRNPGCTNHIAKLAADTKIDPGVHGGLIGPSEALSPWARLLGTREEGGHPRYRADRHTGGAPDTEIRFVSWPKLLFHTRSLLAPPTHFALTVILSKTKRDPPLSVILPEL